MIEIRTAQEVRVADYVRTWRDTVAAVRDNADGTITFTMTNDGDTHTVGLLTSLNVEI